jgi:disulfide bond formation protein DsbB
LRASFLILASVVALIAAYVSQYIFDIKPCILCIYQRVPYFLTIVALIFVFNYSSKIHFSTTMIYFCSFVFMVSALLALFHVGVEKGFIEEPTSCSLSSEENYQTLDQLREAILNSQNSPKCSEVQFSLLGVSMAGWNFIYSLILSIYSFLLGTKLKH